VTRPPAAPTVQVDNERLRVTEWRFPPGGSTGWHRHESDYCVVPLTTGTLTMESAEGTGEARLIAGQAYFRPAGIEHDVINANDFEFVFVEVEVK
jgi:beta-alanine degradation protein BauB